MLAGCGGLLGRMPPDEAAFEGEALFGGPERVDRGGETLLDCDRRQRVAIESAKFDEKRRAAGMNAEPYALQI